jgi:hypothetical protein
VQLGYNREGTGIIFVGELHEDEERNVVVFGDKGMLIDDEPLFCLSWDPILPVASKSNPCARKLPCGYGAPQGLCNPRPPRLGQASTDKLARGSTRHFGSCSGLCCR